MLISAKDIRVGDRIPSNRGTFTVTRVEKCGRAILVYTKEETPEGKYISFARGEMVTVERGVR